MLDIVLAMALVQDTPTATEALPPLVTIEQLHRDPDQWNGRRILVAGYFNECLGFDCRVCDVLSLHNELDEYGNPRSWSSPYCADVEAFADRRQSDSSVRNSLALLETTYSTRCVGDVDYDFEAGSTVRRTFALCTDRSGELTDPELVRVFARDIQRPPLVTIEDIHQDPWAWDGKRIRAIVRANGCFDRNCAVCDEPGEGEPWPAFWSENGRNDACAGVSFVGGRAGDSIARYNTILIEAEYSAGCSGRPRPGEDRFLVCGDRATELLDTIILQIVRGHSALEMRLSDDVRISPPDAPLLEELRDAYDFAAVSDWHERQEPDTYFWVSENYDPSERLAWHWEVGVCECDEEDCFADAPPQTLDQLFGGLFDDFRCFSAVQHEDGSWVFPLQ